MILRIIVCGLSTHNIAQLSQLIPKESVHLLRRPARKTYIYGGVICIQVVLRSRYRNVEIARDKNTYEIFLGQRGVRHNLFNLTENYRSKPPGSRRWWKQVREATVPKSARKFGGEVEMIAIGTFGHES
jgi:hypothetical protein